MKKSQILVNAFWATIFTFKRLFAKTVKKNVSIFTKTKELYAHLL